MPTVSSRTESDIARRLPIGMRKPRVANLIKRAEKADKTVTAITTQEGMTLTLGEAA